jgi:protein-disulfide isomerase
VLRSFRIPKREIFVKSKKENTMWKYLNSNFTVALVVAASVFYAASSYRQGAELSLKAGGGRQQEEPPKPVKMVGLQSQPSMGPSNAPFTLVVVSDHKCPYCQLFEAGTAKQEMKNSPAFNMDKAKKLANAGKVRLVFLNFPLPMHGEEAEKLAEASQCAWKAGTFWKDQESLFKGMIPGSLSACVASGEMKTAVVAAVKLGKDAGVSGTPSLILGKTIPGGGVDGKIYNAGNIDLKSIS